MGVQNQIQIRCGRILTLPGILEKSAVSKPNPKAANIDTKLQEKPVLNPKA